MKKSLIAVIFLLVISLCLGSCVNNTGKNDGTINLSAASAEVAVGGKVTLTAKTENIKESVAWTSSDASIATVDGGTVTGVKKGVATITATAGGVSATCTVSVSETIPLIETEYKHVTVGVNSDFTIGASIFGSDVKADFKWTGADGAESIATAESTDGGRKVTFKGISAGETEYTVSSTVYGITVYAKVGVTVVDTSKTWAVNGQGITPAENDSYNAEINLDKTVAPEITVYNYDSPVSGIDFSWTTDDSSVASVTTDGKITGHKEGTTTVKCTFDGLTILFTVNVVRPLYVMSTHYDVDTYEGRLVLTDTVEGVINGATLNGVDVFSSASGNTVIFNGALHTPETVMGNDGELVINTDKARYSYKVGVYNKVIKTADEFADMKNYMFESAGEGGYAYQYTGYIALGADIDLSGKANLVLFNDSAIGGLSGIESLGFNGTLDGRGYSVKNYTVTSGINGLFAFVGYKAVIKNIAFTDVVATSGAGSRIFSTVFNGLLKDAYFTLKTWDNGKILHSWYQRQRAENVIVRYTGEAIEGVRNFGNDGHYKENIVNVHIIADISGLSTGCKPECPGVCGYHTYKNIEEFKNSGIDYSLFSADVWEIVDGVPVFKSK